MLVRVLKPGEGPACACGITDATRIGDHTGAAVCLGCIDLHSGPGDENLMQIDFSCKSCGKQIRLPLTIWRTAYGMGDHCLDCCATAPELAVPAPDQPVLDPVYQELIARLRRYWALKEGGGERIPSSTEVLEAALDGLAWDVPTEEQLRRMAHPLSQVMIRESRAIHSLRDSIKARGVRRIVRPD